MYRLFSSVDVGQNFLGVCPRDGRADCRVFVQRIADLHRFRSCHQSRHEPIPNVFVNKHSRAVRTDLCMDNTFKLWVSKPRFPVIKTQNSGFGFRMSE